jgi:hypothetical protein
VAVGLDSCCAAAVATTSAVALVLGIEHV